MPGLLLPRKAVRANLLPALWCGLLLGCSSGGGTGGEMGDEAAADDEAEPDDRPDGGDHEPATGNDPDETDAPEPGVPGDPDSADDPSTTPDDVEDPDDPTGVDGCSRAVPEQPLRRLSSFEYHNTLRDLFGEELGRRLVEGSRFPETLITRGFSADAEANVVNTQESHAIEDNAERIAGLIDEDPASFLQQLLPCSLGDSFSDADVDACIPEFIAQFGLRAYRRPLTDSELGLAQRVYDEVRAAGPANAAFAGLIQYFVQAPALLYKVERGGTEAEGDLVPLTQYERATRLAYFLTASLPDDELLERAAAGELATAEQVRAEAERLFDGSRFVEVLGLFHRDWLELHGFDYKEASLFPSFDAARGSLQQETERYSRFVLEEGQGTVSELLGGTRFPLNDVLASYYGVEAPGATTESWVATDVPERRGLLTQASLMATLADSTATNPIHRGGFFQTQVLCRTLPALPGNVDIQGPLQDTSGLPTARERLSPLLERGDCSGCHSIINPVGLAFENYDAAGLYRDTENGSPIDASGELMLDGQVVSFDGPLDLADALAASTEAQECYALNWFRMALGRPEFSQDECSLSALQQAAEASGGDIRELVLALVQTDAFLYRGQVQP